MVRGKAPSRHFHFELNFFDLNLGIEPVKFLQLMHQVYSGFFDAVLSPSQPTLRTRSEPLGVSASPPSDKHSSTEPRDGSLCMDCGTIPSMYCSSGGFWLKIQTTSGVLHQWDLHWHVSRTSILVPASFLPHSPRWHQRLARQRRIDPAKSSSNSSLNAQCGICQDPHRDTTLRVPLNVLNTIF